MMCSGHERTYYDKKNSGHKWLSGKYNGHNTRVKEIENLSSTFDFSEKRDKTKTTMRTIHIHNEQLLCLSIISI